MKNVKDRQACGGGEVEHGGQYKTKNRHWAKKGEVASCGNRKALNSSPPLRRSGRMKERGERWRCVMRRERSKSAARFLNDDGDDEGEEKTTTTPSTTTKTTATSSVTATKTTDGSC